MEEPSELKHLSSQEEERNIDSASSGEQDMGRAKPECVHSRVRAPDPDSGSLAEQLWKMNSQKE